MALEVLTVRCVCGWETTGSEAAVVPATISDLGDRAARLARARSSAA